MNVVFILGCKYMTSVGGPLYFSGLMQVNLHGKIAASEKSPSEPHVY